jgi:hypothetical protein
MNIYIVAISQRARGEKVHALFLQRGWCAARYFDDVRLIRAFETFDFKVRFEEAA